MATATATADFKRTVDKKRKPRLSKTESHHKAASVTPDIVSGHPQFHRQNSALRTQAAGCWLLAAGSVPLL